MDPGHSPGRPVRVLHPRTAGLPHVHGSPAGPEASHRFAGPGPLHRPRHPEGPTGLPAQRAHGVWVGVRPRRVSRARFHRRLPAPLVGSRQALLDGSGSPHEPLRRADEDAHADLCAGRRVPPARTALQPVLLRPEDRARPAREGDHRSCPAAPADRVLRVDGLGRVDGPARAQLLLHEQLAARAARRQQAHRQRRGLVSALPHRAPGRHRRALRRLWSLGAQPRLARSRTGHAQLPPARGGGPDAGAAGDGVVLLRDGGAVPDSDVRRRRQPALPRRDRRLLRLRSREAVPLQPDADLACPAGAVLGGHLVRRGRDLPGADDRPPRAAASGQACLCAARGAGGGGLRDADRLLPRRARGAQGRGLELVRAPGLRVSRPRPPLAGPPVGRPVRVGLHALARAAQAAGRRASRATCRGCSSWRRARSRPSTRSA